MTPGDARAYALMGRMIGAGLWMLAGALAGGIGVLAWQARQPAPASGMVAVAQPARVLTRVERVTVPCEQVRAYAPAAKAKLRLPEAVRENPQAHVLASSDVRATERDIRVSTVLDTDTGAVDTYTEALPLPWLASRRETEIGAYAGLRGGQPVLRLQGRGDLLQIKSLHVGIIASADLPLSPATALPDQSFVGLGVWGRF